MKKLTITIAAVVAVAFFTLDTKRAEAVHGFSTFGLHFGGPNFHLDVGNPHGYRGRHVAARPHVRYGHPGRAYVAKRPCPSRYRWHDTSHWDYIPSHYVPHGNHVDYVPGRMVYHREGHWDRHHGRHR